MAEWRAYYELEPWGELRADFRAGQVCATVANMAGKTRSENAPLAHPADFLSTLAEVSGRPAQGAGPILLADPVEQAKLLRKTLFRKDG